ncbi:MAG TPA: DUF4835 family protein [Ferruginibacter sp.]|nr:DUF4835 family protein [Ferruginibacter sp.]HMP21662.1 DUF4835 family protein [Ferruginibacter sp.]
MKNLHTHHILLLLLFFTQTVQAQELSARVSVNATRIANTVNRQVFATMQNALTGFLNNRKWTTDNFLPNEKIECSFVLNLKPTPDENVYGASLTIQSARPVFNTAYQSPIINFQDEDFTFKYVQFQQLEFNDNRVSGNDALASNLTAVLAYYAYLIIAFDYDSYASKGGTPIFLKAQNIVNNAPEARGISGWKAFDGIRNRYWLTENMLNSRYSLIHDVYYGYYRLAFDKMYEDEKAARTEMLNVLNMLTNFNADNPNTMVLQFFFLGKANELIKLFQKGTPQEKQRASALLQKLDLTNAARYKDELK